MTQKEFHRQVNARFYAYVEENFPQYEIDHSEGYGRIYLLSKDKKADNSIEYHQSRHELCCMNNASESTKEDIETMEKYINNNIIPFLKLVEKDLES